MNDIIDLTGEYPTPSSQIPAPPSSTSSNYEDEAEGSTPPLKWYKKVNTGKGRGGHPYVCEAIAMQTSKEPSFRYEDCKFWPFVRALNPWRVPSDVEWRGWKEYDGTIALCAIGKVVVARCTENDPWKVLWELDIEDYPYTVAWSYHPFSCHPIIATAGQKGLIYIIDAITKRCIRILRGHGGDITNLSFHPLHPHILSSTSYDKTTRIWNILGSDPPELPKGEKPSMNFPMGDADEGNCLVAILAGDNRGGHRGYVASASFHPTKNAIATVGLDRHVKIWPLPAFPRPSLKGVPTPKGYRARIIHLPLFSSTRLHEDFVDNVEWLNEYTLITRSRRQLKIWQWLAYARYFAPNDPLPKSMDPTSQDYMDSGSFMPIVTYPLGSDCWAMNLSLHRPIPFPREDSADEDDNTVYDPLIGMVAHRQGTFTPEIILFNPLLARDHPCDIPPPIDEKRINDKVEDGSDSDLDSEEDEDDDGISISNRSRKQTSSNPNANATGTNPSLESWRLIPQEYQTILQKHAKRGFKVSNKATNVCNVSISPGGAEWIVGVGEPGMVFVWKMNRRWKFR
ncbi:hypothetical protein I302_108838 [Kwoniella bestiolae CBS 10118]|uniref:Uncharacterized protein n=1 Tax=Kwoniella bestiolae CBS 10118 TaxID=1296100 RepID=A0A1B9FU82_9TREE|nr:hypothetical protein I302_07977 [Kwoniella bestiolae CBS 10118]OCF22330.1 hypothetical protein I302_07977 [Kwoniella bestiolae CBS 10118]